MKHFILFRGYYDCPTCDGTGDLELKICNNEEEVLTFIQQYVDGYEVESIFDENEEHSFEVEVSKSFHRIHLVEIKELKNKKRNWKISRPHGKWEIQEV